MELEIEKTRRDWKKVLILLVLILIPLLDAGILYFDVYSDYWFYPEDYPNGPSHMHRFIPTVAAFLSGNSHGHLMQMIFIFLMPIYIMIMNADSYLQEKSCGYLSTCYTRISRKTYLMNKWKSAFSISTGVTLVAILLNLVVCYVLFWGGTWTGGGNEEDALYIYLIYVISFCLIVGLYGVYCSCLCMITGNRMIAYALAVLPWLGMIHSPWSIVNAMQPYTEYGYEYFVIAWLQILILCGLTILFTKLVWEKRDEL
ncbi:hypothetical protein [Agathobacter ruminis]|uniref:Uncharacterized protein n=1 Tax=Agathobacter ruminis TaxID=1712665 RepID=A0A2G3E528_9FIRM|nr:hypothetical protein [Agathobacter ruminis]MDC7301159.1 hypothetical protein [Agathobacter ruminis]PHU38376.1 hypothetical protein CSX02_03205 [Agathobacter ruminis]